MIKFNNRELPSWISVTGISFQTANVSIIEHEAKRRVGNFDAGIDKGGININLDLFIKPVEGLSILDQADELKRFMMGDNWEVSELILTEQPNKYYNARVDDVGEVTDNFTHGENSISFYASDPKKYDVNESVVTGTSEVIIEYDGLESTPVRVELVISQNVSNPTVKHEESGKEIALEGQFKSGDKVIIDTDARNILLNNNSIKNKMMFKSNWISLQPGTNTFNTTSAEGVVGSMKIKYRKAD